MKLSRRKWIVGSLSLCAILLPLATEDPQQHGYREAIVITYREAQRGAREGRFGCRWVVLASDIDERHHRTRYQRESLSRLKSPTQKLGISGDSRMISYKLTGSRPQ